MSADLAAFLVARYDEAEALAKAATPGPWVAIEHVTDDQGVITDSRYPAGSGFIMGTPVMSDDESRNHADAAFIAANDPARRLADIRLKRAILAEHAPWQIGPDWVVCERCVDWTAGTYYGDEEDGDEEPRDMSRMSWPCATVRQLGTEFAEHDGYKQEWAP